MVLCHPQGPLSFGIIGVSHCGRILLYRTTGKLGMQKLKHSLEIQRHFAKVPAGRLAVGVTFRPADIYQNHWGRNGERYLHLMGKHEQRYQRPYAFYGRPKTFNHAYLMSEMDEPALMVHLKEQNNEFWGVATEINIREWLKIINK